MSDEPENVGEANVRLADALAQLYAVLANHSAPKALHASSLRHSTKILEELTSVPLKQLPAVAIGPFAMYAVTTVGDVGDYKYFLPRIIHLAIIGGEGEPGLQATAIASKLEYANWASWPEPERAAVIKAFEAGWARLRFFHPDDHDAEDWLSALAMLGVDVIPKLTAWIADVEPDSMAQFAQFVARMRDLKEPDGISADIPYDMRQAMADVICGGSAEDALRRAALTAADSDIWLFEEALKVITELKYS